MSLSSEQNRKANQLASDWMHRGMDLAAGDSALTLGQAIKCFDEAIALRKGLPLADNPLFRFGLSAGWINRGDALARLDGLSITEAIASYDEALVLLESLPMEEDVRYPRRLGIARLNRGAALKKRNGPHDQQEAVADFRKAIAILESASGKGIADHAALLGAAWLNLAGTLFETGHDREVILAARQALLAVKSCEGASSASGEIGLKANHLLCRLAVKKLLEGALSDPNLIMEATDAVEDVLDGWRSDRFTGQSEGLELAREIFCFGCLIYAEKRPQFLGEFLGECLDTLSIREMIFSHEKVRASAQAAIWSVLAKLQGEGFHALVKSDFNALLVEVEQLRKVEERLKAFDL